MSRNQICLRLSVGKSILTTFSYVILKLILALSLFSIIEKYFDNPFLQLEIGELISTVATLTLLIIIFRASIFKKNENAIPFPKINFLILLVILVISFRLFKDPFFKYEYIFFGKTNPDISSLTTIEFSIDVYLKAIRIVMLQSIFEELLFRKVIFDGLMKKYSRLWFAIGISSILFSISHLSIQNAIPTFTLGIISAFVYYSSKNISYSIVLHILVNIFWFVLYINPKGYWRILEYLNFGISYWLVSVFGAGVLVLTLRKIALYKP